MATLPRIARALLRVALPSDWRDDIVCELAEAYGERRTRSRVRAWLWIVLEAVVFAVRFVPERVRDLRGGAAITSLDLRLAGRAVRRTPWLSGLSVISLALGIGVTAGVFVVIRGAFFSPLPFPEGERVVLVGDYNATRRYPLSVDPAEYLRRRDLLTSFEQLGAYHSRRVVVGRGDGEGRPVLARFVTPEVLRLARRQPLLGRLPDEVDAQPGATPVVVLPYFLWSAELGADPEILGETLEIAGERRTVIGVMPEDFGMPWGNELWMPFDARDTFEPLELVGRLREGVSLEAARTELATMARTDPTRVGNADDAVEYTVVHLNRPATADAQLVALGGPLLALILLLIVMATNVATLVVAKNAARTGELAVRVALGASRRRVIGQLVLEVALVVAIAAGVGVALARWGVGTFERRVADVPFYADFSLDARAFAFVVGLATLTTLVAGLAPALRATRGPVHDALKDGARGASQVRFGRLTRALVVVELAVCVGFLSAAAVLGRTLFSFGFGERDFPAAETLVAQLYFGWPDALRDPQSTLTSDQRARIRTDFLARATAHREAILRSALTLPGARLAVAGSRFPGDESETTRVLVEGMADASPRRTELAEIGAGYFEVLDARVLAGRDFTRAEYTAESNVVIVNEPFVARHLGGRNPLGRRIKLVPADADALDTTPWLEIVGVVPGLGLSPGDPARADGVYRPLGDTNILRVAIRGAGAPVDWVPSLIEIVRKVDPDIEVQWTTPLDEHMRRPVSLFRALGAGLLALGGIALLLSGASLHALTACAVSRRTREIGIRQALGASRTRVVRSVLRETTLQLAAGAALGGVLGLLLLRLSDIVPWQIERSGTASLGLVIALLGSAVLLALAGPLHRALSIRPADALRHD